MSNIKDTVGDTYKEAVSELGDTSQAEEQDNSVQFSVDDLVDIDFGDDDIFGSEESFKGVKPADALKNADPEVKKLYANLRKDYTRKTQELAKQRNELEAQKRALIESDFFKENQEKALRDLGDSELLVDDEVKQYVEREVARRMQDMMKPMETEYKMQQRKLQLDGFKQEHPDWSEYKNEMFELLKSNENMTFDNAYFIVKGKTSTKKMREYEGQLNERNKLIKDAGLKIGGRRRTEGGNLPARQEGMSDRERARQIYNWVKSQNSK